MIREIREANKMREEAINTKITSALEEKNTQRATESEQLKVSVCVCRKFLF